MEMRSEDENLIILNNWVQIEQPSLYLITYLYKAYARLQDATVNTFMNSLFAGLPEEKMLSWISRVTESEKDDFGRHVHDQD